MIDQRKFKLNMKKQRNSMRTQISRGNEETTPQAA